MDKDLVDNQDVEIKIPIESLFSSFSEHIKIKNNNRIFFSGKFGIGKTYFLNEFFKKYESEYEIFHLYPVNYQISTNENIIELLKYDILIELLSKKGNIFDRKTDIGFSNRCKLFYSIFKEKVTVKKFL